MIAAVIINGLLVAASVLIHYEILSRLSIIIPVISMPPRFKVVLGVLGALCAHVIEIWLFAFGYFYMIDSGLFGTLEGRFDGSLLDCVYFSFTTYSTLGFGDIEPVGLLRFLVGLEALTGLVLITWSASFMFIEMQKFWQDD